MDLSNLSRTLPPEGSIEAVLLHDLNRDLAVEFKDAARAVAALNSADQKSRKGDFASAARSVASLYRLGIAALTLAGSKGYLDCLDDLLSVIANGEDVENWALTKRAEITNTRQREFSIPQDCEFVWPKDMALSMQFRPSFAPLLVSYKRKPKRRERRRLESSSSDSEDTSDADVRKRRALQLLEPCKRRKEE